MKRLLTLLLPLFLLATAAAEELRSDEHRCVITLPDNVWQSGNIQRLPVGEVIFNAANMETKQSVSVIVIPDFPTSDLDSPAALARFTEIIKAQGFEVKSQKTMEWLGRPFIEIIGRRLNDATGELVSVTRAAIVEKKAFLVSTFGRGDESRMEDERFMRVIKSFRFMDASEKPLTITVPFLRYYRAGYILCIVVMLVLMVAFTIMYIRTQRRR